MFLKVVGVSSWKKGHFASNVPLPRSRTHMDKGQKQSDLLIIFSSGKGLVLYGTPLCPLFRKCRYSAYYGCSKTYFVSFLLYIDLVFCFFAAERNKILEQYNVFGPRGPSSVPKQKIKTLLCDFALIYLYFVSYLSVFRRTGRK